MINTQELKLGFEKVVLTKVGKILGESHSASFYNGTLFVKLTKKRLKKCLMSYHLRMVRLS